MTNVCFNLLRKIANDFCPLQKEAVSLSRRKRKAQPPYSVPVIARRPNQTKTIQENQTPTTTPMITPMTMTTNMNTPPTSTPSTWHSLNYPYPLGKHFPNNIYGYWAWQAARAKLAGAPVAFTAVRMFENNKWVPRYIGWGASGALSAHDVRVSDNLRREIFLDMYGFPKDSEERSLANTGMIHMQQASRDYYRHNGPDASVHYAPDPSKTVPTATFNQASPHVREFWEQWGRFSYSQPGTRTGAQV